MAAGNDLFVELFRQVPAPIAGHAAQATQERNYTEKLVLALKLLKADEDAFSGTYAEVDVGLAMLRAALVKLGCAPDALANNGTKGGITEVLIAARDAASVAAAAADDGGPEARERKRNRTEDKVAASVEADRKAAEKEHAATSALTSFGPSQQVLLGIEAAEGASATTLDAIAALTEGGFASSYLTSGADPLPPLVLKLFKTDRRLHSAPGSRTAQLQRLQKPYVKYAGSLLNPIPTTELVTHGGSVGHEISTWIAQQLISGNWTGVMFVKWIHHLSADMTFIVPMLEEWKHKPGAACHAWKEPDVESAGSTLPTSPGAWHHHFVPASTVQLATMLRILPPCYDFIFPHDAGGAEQLIGLIEQLVRLQVPSPLALQFLHQLLVRVDECIGQDRFSTQPFYWSLRTPKQLSAALEVAQKRSADRPADESLKQNLADVQRRVSMWEGTGLMERFDALSADAKQVLREAKAAKSNEEARRTQEEVAAEINGTPVKSPASAPTSGGTPKGKGKANKRKRDELDEDEEELPAYAQEMMKALRRIESKSGRKDGGGGGGGGARDQPAPTAPPVAAPGPAARQLATRQPQHLDKPGQPLTGFKAVPAGGWKASSLPRGWKNYPPTIAMKAAHVKRFGKPQDMPQGSEGECLRFLYPTLQGKCTDDNCKFYHSDTVVSDEEKAAVANEAARMWAENDISFEESE